MVHGWTKLNLKNIPYPKVTIFNNDSYVSIKQCIADYHRKSYSLDTRSNGNTEGHLHKLIDSPLVNIVFETSIKVDVGLDLQDIIIILGVR